MSQALLKKLEVKSRNSKQAILCSRTSAWTIAADMRIDYTKEKFEDVAKNVDVVLDSIGGDTLARSYRVVKKGGIIVSLVARPKESELEKHGIRGIALNVEPNSEELAEIGNLIDDKKIKVIVSQRFPLSEAMKAHEQ